MQTLAVHDVPHLDRRIGVARHQNVLAQLHAGRQTLVAHQRVFAGARCRLPHPNGCVQGAGHNVDAVKLKITNFKYQYLTNSTKSAQRLPVVSTLDWCGPAMCECIPDARAPKP